MEKQIKEVQDYFINKLMNKDYMVTNLDNYKVSICIDNKFLFSIWMANGSDYVKTDSTINDSFMLLEFTQKQKYVIYSNLKESYFEYINNIAIREKEHELDLLKAKISKQDTHPTSQSFG